MVTDNASNMIKAFSNSLPNWIEEEAASTLSDLASDLQHELSEEPDDEEGKSCIVNSLFSSL